MCVLSDLAEDEEFPAELHFPAQWLATLTHRRGAAPLGRRQPFPVGEGGAHVIKGGGQGPAETVQHGK